MSQRTRHIEQVEEHALPPCGAAADAMRSWSVADVARYLRSVDLMGRADVCQLNRVNGADLADMTQDVPANSREVLPHHVELVEVVSATDLN